MNFSKKIITVPIIGSVLFFSCNQAGNQNEKNADDQLSTEEIIEKDTRSFNYILPSPLQIASIFHRSKLSFNDKLLNNTKNVTKYNTETKRTLNLGVYATDLAYCLLNSQNQLSLTYLKTTRDLADKIGMSSVYNTQELVERFQKNINNVDSLTDILSTIQSESKAFLEENERRFTALSIFTGAWVEAIYIATKSIENRFNEKIMKEIAEQHISLRNLIKLLNEHPESKQPEFNDILSKLNEINAVYEQSADYKAKPIEEGEEMPFEFNMTPEETKVLGAKVTELRNLIID